MGIENVGNVMVLLDLERIHNRAQWLILSVYIFTTYLLVPVCFLICSCLAVVVAAIHTDPN